MDDIMWLFTVPGAKLAIKASVFLSAVLLIVQIARWALKSKARNPFSTEGLDQAGLECHQNKHFDPVKVPPRIDVVVVGSDISCLTTASILAKTGRTVVVLEPAPRLGGDDDVDLLSSGQMGPPTSLFRILLDQVTVKPGVQWQPLEDVHHVVNIGPKSFPVHCDLATWKTSLLGSFPNEKKGIERFFNLITSTSPRTLLVQYLLKRMPLSLTNILSSLGFFSLLGGDLVRGSRPTQPALAKFTSNKDLQVLMGHLWLYCATPSDRSNLKMHALFHKHFEGGSFYPVGGMSELASKIVPVIEATGGGRVFHSADIRGILHDGKKAMGVTVAHGGDTYHVVAPVIVSGLGVKKTFTQMLPKQVSDASRLRPLCQDIGSCLPMVRVTLEVGHHKLKAQQLIVLDTDNMSMIVSTVTQGVVVAMMPFDGTSQDDLSEQMVEKCCELLPSIAKKIKSKKVEIVDKGLLDLSVERFSARNCASLRPETDVSGLYLTGPDVLTTSLCGRLMAGLMTAGAVLERHIMWDLIDLRKSLVKAGKIKSY